MNEARDLDREWLRLAAQAMREISDKNDLPLGDWRLLRTPKNLETRDTWGYSYPTIDSGDGKVGVLMPAGSGGPFAHAKPYGDIPVALVTAVMGQGFYCDYCGVDKCTHVEILRTRMRDLREEDARN